MAKRPGVATGGEGAEASCARELDARIGAGSAAPEQRADHQDHEAIQAHGRTSSPLCPHGLFRPFRATAERDAIRRPASASLMARALSAVCILQGTRRRKPGRPHGAEIAGPLATTAGECRPRAADRRGHQQRLAQLAFQRAVRPS
jgi:hypothetical protein